MKIVENHNNAFPYKICFIKWYTRRDLDKMELWCAETFGEACGHFMPGAKWAYAHNTTFSFCNLADATWFLLKWC